MIILSGYGDEISPDLNEQLEVLTQEGINYLDLRSVWDKNVLTLTDKEVAYIKHQLDQRGIKVHSISTPIGKSDITEDFTPRLKEFMRAVRLAKFFGTPYIRIFSFYYPKGENPWKYKDEVVSRLRQLTRIAEREGIILMHENEKRIFGDNGERIRYLMQTINSSHLRFAFDPANFVQSQVLPMTDAYPYVEPYISWVQLKDALINTGKVVPAGEGDGQVRQLLQALKKKNYSGFISIESHLEAEGRFAGFSKAQLFVVAARAVKKLLEEEGLLVAAPETGTAAGQGMQPNTDPVFSCPPLMLPRYLDQWIPLVSLETMAQNEYDVLIVGSGAGGGAALWRLSEQWRNTGKRIGMVEAGGLLLPTSALNVSTLDPVRFNEFIFNPNISVPLNFPEFPAARVVYALGGRTLVWDVNTPRMHPSVLNEWPVTPKEMEHYYDIAERIMNVTQAYTRDSPINRKMVGLLRQNGFTEATDTPKAMNLTPVRNGRIQSDVFFSSLLFLAYALHIRSFDLAVHARAVRVLTANGQAQGVEVKDRQHRSFVLRAKNIIVSASTFESPRLLLHSGITNRALGHYLMDHNALKAVATVSRRELPEEFGPLWIWIPQTVGHPYQFLISRTATAPSADQVEIIIRGYGAPEPRFENMVTLDPARIDEYGVPKLQVSYSYSSKDRTTITEVAAAMKRVLSALGATSLSQEICLRPPGDDHHESGTCRMGNDPATSATNRYGQIHGVSGLYVADNSVLPSLGTANPTLSTVALAIRTADHIAARMKEKA